MTTDELIYIASPYTHTDIDVMQQRFTDVCIVCSELIKLGYHVFSPIAHGYGISKVSDLSSEWKFWEDDCKLMIDKCDSMFVLMIDGYESSIGVAAEIKYAKSKNMNICYLEPNTMELHID